MHTSHWVSARVPQWPLANGPFLVPLFVHQHRPRANSRFFCFVFFFSSNLELVSSCDILNINVNSSCQFSLRVRSKTQFNTSMGYKHSHQYKGIIPDRVGIKELSLEKKRTFILRPIDGRFRCLFASWRIIFSARVARLHTFIAFPI